jgi:hypothetical protein
MKALLWDAPMSARSGPVGGFTARPAQYEQRVIGFFDDARLEEGE